MLKTHHHPPESSPLRFSVDESPPNGLAFLLAVQTVALIIAGIVLGPAIVLRAAEMSPALEPGVIFFALAISGAITVIQARRIWRIGAGYILLMGTSGAFIAVSITALTNGGLPLLMTLIVVSSMFQFLLASQLLLLRRIITPLVGGTTIMLLAVTVMPYAFGMFEASSPGNPGWQDPLVAFSCLAIILGLSFFGSNRWRLWAPVIGIVVASLLSAVLGDLDASRVLEAKWFGIPEFTWPGFDLSFGQDFWVLLPAFIIVTLVGAIETYGDAIAVQRISSREEDAVDFRCVQGALNADGLGNLLSGLAGTMPNTTYSTSISVVDLTGVASRKVGVFCGVLMVVLAFFPKIAAVILSIPEPVVGAYLMVLILLLFMHGIRMVARDGLTYEKGFVVGMGFWLGLGFQQKVIFADAIPSWLAPILGNGMTAGTVITLILVGLLSLKRGPRKSMETHLSIDAIEELRQMVGDFSGGRGWSREANDKLALAVEEVMEAMVEIRGVDRHSASEKLHLEMEATGQTVQLSIAVAPLEHDIHELIEATMDHKPLGMSELPFETLGMLVTELDHYRYFGLDYISMSIDCAPETEETKTREASDPE